MASTNKAVGLGLVIIIAFLVSIQLSGIVNKEAHIGPDFIFKSYSIIISSNSAWEANGIIITEHNILPVNVSILNGTYMYRNFKNPLEIYLIISRIDPSSVENTYLDVKLLRGNKLILIEESKDLTLEFKWLNSG
jgi:hypothetical protein